jgi:hypothetical protein
VAFEDWHSANYVQTLEKYGDSYKNMHVRNRWQGWLGAKSTPPAAQPAPVPLTEGQRSKMYRTAVLRGDSIMVRSDYELGISDTEAAHGITKGQP